MTNQAVQDPAIPEVLDMLTGDHKPVSEVIGNDYARAVKLRMAVKEKQKKMRLCMFVLCAVSQ